MQNNLINIVKTINIYNNEVWFKQFPVASPLGEDYFFCGNHKKIEKNLKQFREAVMYINIPFCNNKCDYCGHRGISGINVKHSKNYVKCLKREIECITNGRKNKIEILAVLIGGGTPSLLYPEDLKDLLFFLKKKFNINKHAQISIEVSPEDISKKIAFALSEGGVNRVCIGVQSFNDENIKECGRRSQKSSHVYEAVDNLRLSGINNISLDLIFGLHGNNSSKNFMKDNFEHITKIKPTSIDLYAIQDHVKYADNIFFFQSKEFEKVKKEIFLKLSSWNRRKKIDFPNNIDNTENILKNLPKEFSAYFFLRRLYNINCISIGAGGKNELWINGQFVEKVNKRNRFDAIGYMYDAGRGVFNYNYSTLTISQSIRKYIVHNLCPGSAVNKLVLNKISSFCKNNLNNVIINIKDYILEDKNKIEIKKNFEDYLPFRTQNRFVNYFIFTFCYIYSEEDRKKLMNAFRRNFRKNK
ncbi:MAG: radical SAM protein [Candidatus Gastranaerophilaceae bacterium]